MIVFESNVILNTTKTLDQMSEEKRKFESNVILNTTKTQPSVFACYS